MKRYAAIVVVLAGFLISPLFTQGQAPAPAPAAVTAQSTAAPSTADAIRAYYNGVKNNLLKAADKMPDDGYAFKPTPEERSFGGWIAHVADAQTAGCSRILGITQDSRRGIENYQGRSRRGAERFLRHLRRRLRRPHRRQRRRHRAKLPWTHDTPRIACGKRRAR